MSIRVGEINAGLCAVGVSCTLRTHIRVRAMYLWICGVGQGEKWRMKTGDIASMGWAATFYSA